jgi:hypothetical protein
MKENIEKRNEKANEKINMKRTPYASNDFLDQNTLTYIAILALRSSFFFTGFSNLHELLLLFR